MTGSTVWHVDGSDAPLSGAVPFAVGAGMPSVARIPVPGTNGLAVELRPRGWMPAVGSTSTIFIQDVSGKRHLRLDYGYNTKTKTIDYHWNQKGTASSFGISDHTPAARSGQIAHGAARYLRWGGRVLLVVGATLDAISIVQASRPLRRASEVVAGWAAAWMGCKIVGRGGAIGGSLVKPGLGTAVGAIGGCVIGGVGGYFLGSAAGGEAFDWAEGTMFSPLPAALRP